MKLTPKQKAKELVLKFKELPQEGTLMFYITFEISKQCALIALDEIIKSLENYGKESDELQNMENNFRYWQEVRQELLKM